MVHPKSCSLLLNTFQSAAAGTLKYRCGTNKRGGEQDLMDLASIKCQTSFILTASSFAAALSLLSPPGAQNVTMRFCRSPNPASGSQLKVMQLTQPTALMLNSRNNYHLTERTNVTQKFKLMLREPCWKRRQNWTEMDL